MSIELKVNPEFKKLIPALTEDEYNQLEQNCISEGIRDSLVIWQGTIIDGHNRYEIAKKNQLDFTTLEMNFADNNDAKIWIVINQFGRRNLNNYQRSVLAIKLEEFYKSIAKKKQSEGGKYDRNNAKLIKKQVPENSPKPIETRKELANIARVSDNTISKVKVIESKASDEQKAKLLSDLASIDSVYKSIKKSEEIKTAKEKIINEVKQGLTYDPIIYEESYTKFLNRFSGQRVKLILTDPPYVTEYNDVKTFEEFTNDWLTSAYEKLDEEGAMFVFTGAYPVELRTYFNCKLPSQLLIWTYKNTLGVTPKNLYKQNYQTILFYKKPNFSGLNTELTNEMWAVNDINAPDGRQGDRHYKYQKPIELIEKLIRHTTKTMDTIIDPFVGSGTTLLAASKLNRKSYGCDVSKEAIEISINRGCKLSK